MDSPGSHNTHVAGKVDASPTGSDHAGKTFGDFRLLRKLGEGGMGQVYLAEQVSLKRNVAIKIMRPEIALQATAFERFKGEAESIARVNHTNIVQVYALGEEQGTHYMALEYVEGRNLREYLERKGSVDVPLGLSIMRQTAAALQRASELGIVHRDIKPENILLTRRGEVKVADFGLSRCVAPDRPPTNLTQSGLTMGTPLYMSPEQIQGFTIDFRTDIYSLGITCYQMFAGEPPFRGGNTFELVSKHVHAEPPPLASARPDVPIEICQVIHKMIAKEPANRFQTCGELLKEISRIREKLAIQRTAANRVLNSDVIPVDDPELESATAVLEPVPKWHWKPVLQVVGTLAIALVVGLAAGFVTGRFSPASDVSDPETPSTTIVSPDQRAEQVLWDSLELDASATNDFFNQSRGLSTRIELGSLYLKQRRLQQLEEFIQKKLQPSDVESYKLLGRLFHAIGLGYEEKTKASNELFLELLVKRPEFVAYWNKGLAQSPQLRREISRALDFNRRNQSSEAAFPQQLERFRDPPRPTAGPGNQPKLQPQKKPGDGKKT